MNRSVAGLLGWLCLAEIASMSTFGTFSALLPTFLNEWSISNSAGGWISGIFYVGYTVAVPALVAMTDRVDPRRVYAVGCAIGVIASLGFAFMATGAWSAGFFRFWAGVGLAGTYMPGLKQLSDLYQGDRQARAVAFYTSSFGLGASLSFLFADLLATQFGWPGAFIGAGAGPAVAALIMLTRVPASPPRAKAETQAHLLDFRPVLRNRRAVGFILAYTVHNYELFAFRAWIVAFLAYSQSLQPDGAAGWWSPAAIAGTAILLGQPASILGNEIAQRIGRLKAVTTFMLVSFALGSLLGYTAALPFWIVVTLCCGYIIMNNSDSAALTSGVVAAALPQHRGATMGLYSCIGFFGAFLGPLAVGIALDFAGQGQPGLGAWGIALMAGAAAVVLGPIALHWAGRTAGNGTAKD